MGHGHSCYCWGIFDVWGSVLRQWGHMTMRELINSSTVLICKYREKEYNISRIDGELKDKETEKGGRTRGRLHRQ